MAVHSEYYKITSPIYWRLQQKYIYITVLVLRLDTVSDIDLYFPCTLNFINGKSMKRGYSIAYVLLRKPNLKSKHDPEHTADRKIFD